MSDKTRKRKSSSRGDEQMNKSTRKKRKRMRQVGTSATSVQVSQQALTRQQQIASDVLDEAVGKTADEIRSGSKALARVSQDPAVQKEFAITVEKVGDALAAVAENSGKITAEMVKKFSPAFKQYVFAASDMVNETVFDTAMGAVGAIPIVGDVVATAGQVLKSGNKNSWRSFFATVKAIPDAVNIAGQAVTDAEENVKVLRQTNQQFQKMANAINNITKADEMKTVAGTKGKKKSKKLPRASANASANAAAAGGGKTRKKRKKKRRKKRTKKKARKH
tara:strand:- start:835 stop:1668 length:834 start_codon:yes stop_codon:yes gene_type:complete